MPILAVRLALSHLRQKIFSRVVVVVSVACILLINAVVFLLFQSFSKSLAEVRGPLATSPRIWIRRCSPRARPRWFRR